jgi:hypothetical protein
MGLAGEAGGLFVSDYAPATWSNACAFENIECTAATAIQPIRQTPIPQTSQRRHFAQNSVSSLISILHDSG